ncbi:MAG: cell division protein FtsL [Parcubacteria group bacterium]|nr:cell division protein FtsL [Parcubacteria group bacterium]
MHTHKAQQYVRWQAIPLVLFIALLVAYVWQMNREAAHSFSLEALSSERDALTAEIENLTWEVSEARSLAAVRSRAVGLSLASPVDVSFLEVGLSTVAVAGAEQAP